MQFIQYYDFYSEQNKNAIIHKLIEINCLITDVYIQIWVAWSRKI